MAILDSIKRHKKPIIITLSIIAGLFILVKGTEIFIKSKVRQIITDVTHAPTAPYDASVGRVSVSLANRAFTLEDISLTTKKDVGATTFTTIKLKKITARGIGFKKIDGKYRIKVGKAEVVSPTLIISSDRIDVAQVKAEKKASKKKKRIEVESVSIGTIKVSNGYFEYNFHDDNTNYTAGGINISADSITLDKSYCKAQVCKERITATIDSLRYTSLDGYLLAGADTLKIDTRERTISLASVLLLPQKYPKYEYAKHSPDNVDWTQMICGPVECFGVDYPRLIADTLVSVDSIYVGGGTIASFKNRQIMAPQKEKSIFYIGLQQLPVKVNIPVILSENMNITYEELSPKGDMPGAVNIDQAKAKFIGLTNLPERRDDYFILDSECRLMGQALARSTFHFPVNPTRNVKIEGSMDPMSMTAFNGMITPLSGIRVNSGNIKSIKFDVTANSVKSDVSLVFLYNDLSITLFKEKKWSIVEREFLTGIVDNIIIRSSNPRKNGKTHTGVGSFKRDPYKSQFNYLWKSVFAGVKNTVI